MDFAKFFHKKIRLSNIFFPFTFFSALWFGDAQTHSIIHWKIWLHYQVEMGLWSLYVLAHLLQSVGRITKVIVFQINFRLLFCVISFTSPIGPWNVYHLESSLRIC